MADTRQHFPPNNEARQPNLRDVGKFSAGGYLDFILCLVFPRIHVQTQVR